MYGSCIYNVSLMLDLTSPEKVFQNSRERERAMSQYNRSTRNREGPIVQKAYA